MKETPRPKLIIRDGLSEIKGIKDVFEAPSGEIEIIAEDGRTLFSIRLAAGGIIRISTSSACKQSGVLLDTGLLIKPIVSNAIEITRPLYV